MLNEFTEDGSQGNRSITGTLLRRFTIFKKWNDNRSLEGAREFTQFPDAIGKFQNDTEYRTMESM